MGRAATSVPGPVRVKTAADCFGIGKVAIDIKLQQNRRVITRPAGLLRICPLKSEVAKIKLLDKDIEHPNRIVITDPIFQTLTK